MRQVRVAQLLAQHEGHQVLDHSITDGMDLEAAYVHSCANETVIGVEFHYTPDVGETPLMGDMSSPSTRSSLVDYTGAAQWSIGVD